MSNPKAVKLYQSGMAYLKKGQSSNAERAFRKSVKLDPNFADAHNDLGNTCLQQGRYREAFNAYQKALKLVPDHPGLLNNLANALIGQGEYRKALKWLDRAIEKDPAFSPAICSRGNALRRLGDNFPAVRAYRRAVELQPEHADYRYNLGKALLAIGENLEAIDCFEQVLAENRRNPRALGGLGRGLDALGDLAGAESAYREVIEIEPTNPRWHCELAVAYENHGDKEGALACLRQALEIEPGRTDLWPILARVKTFAADDPDIETMENLVANRRLPESDRAKIGFSLAKAYEDSGDFDNSIEQLLAASRQKFASFDYSMETERAFFEGIRTFFSAALVSEYGDGGCRDSSPIFILGMPRSGTSLVEQILASHHDVFGAGEIKDLANVYQTLAPSTETSIESGFPEALRNLGAEDFARIGETYIESIRKYADASAFITNKMPHNFIYVGFIRLILPEARIIHCTRNPLDNCLSLFKTDFVQGHPYSYDLRALGQYYRLYQELMAHWNQVLPGFIYEQNYESLVQDQEAQTRQLLEYCGLDWDPACLEFHQTRRRVNTASNLQVKRPIYRDSVDLWKRYEDSLQPLVSELDA